MSYGMAPTIAWLMNMREKQVLARVTGIQKNCHTLQCTLKLF